MSQAEQEITLRVKAGRIALAFGLLILGVKLAAYALTGSSAVLSDALESIVNVVAAALLLYSLYIAARPADRDHPYGHGKVEFFSAGVEGTLVAIAAALILVEAVRDLVRGPEIQRIDLGLLLVGAAALGNGLIGSYLVRVGKRTNSLALVADGRHLWTDVVTSVGVFVGLLVVRFTGWLVFDPLVAILVGLNILRTGWQLIREAVAGLMDEADVDLLEAISAGLERERESSWIDVHGLRAWKSGSFHHVDMHMSVPRYFNADQLHEIDDRVGELVEAHVEGQGEVIVHFDPCRPRQCPGCGMSDCRIREAEAQQRSTWTVTSTTRMDEWLETGRPVASETTVE